MIKRPEKPEAVSIAADVNGEPVSISRHGKRHRVVAIYERWRLADGWWGREEKRGYFRIRTDHGLVCDVYHDTVAGRWHVDRVYD